jgi:hypothetical protein
MSFPHPDELPALKFWCLYLMLQRIGAFNIDVSGKTGNGREKKK